MSGSLDLVFDYTNDVMDTYHDTIHNLWYVIALIAIASFIVLAARGVGWFSVWTLIEYMQLVALIPTYNFKMISYLYDAFKPAMISHLIFFTNTPGLHHMDKNWYTDSYRYYGLSDARLLQGCIGIAFLCFFLATGHLICHLLAKSMKGSPVGMWCQWAMDQLLWNVYLRVYMLCFFSLCFFTMRVIMANRFETQGEKALLFISYVIFVFNVAVASMFTTVIQRWFDILKPMLVKRNCRTLLLKVDKRSRWRVLSPTFFFARRILTAILITLPGSTQFIFLQYVFILMTSFAYILYIISIQPHHTNM
jgi:hypothetical protein